MTAPYTDLDITKAFAAGYRDGRDLHRQAQLLGEAVVLLWRLERAWLLQARTGAELALGPAKRRYLRRLRAIVEPAATD